MRNAARKRLARAEPARASKPKAEPERAPEEEPVQKRDPALALAQARAGASGGPPDDRGGAYFTAPAGAAQALARSSPSGAVGGARIHTDEHAAAGAHQLGAAAVTVGRDIYFGARQYAPGTAEGDRLLGHELAHVGQFSGRRPAFAGAAPLQVAREHHPAERAAAQGAVGAFRTARPVAFRHPVAPTTVTRRTRDEIFGTAAVAASGMSLDQFKTYTEAQADWFRHPSLTSADRDALWALLLRNESGTHLRAGVGDVKVRDLVAVAPGDWPALEAFCHGADPAGDTLRIHAVSSFTLAERIAHGQTLLDLEALITAPVLHLAVSESQLRTVHSTAGLLTLLRAYWADFHPHLQDTTGYDPSTAGGQGPEFQRMLDLLNTAGTAGMARIRPLATGHWVRDAHRFSFDALTQLVDNLADTTGLRRLVLVLHTGHDTGSFQEASHLFNDLIIGSRATNNVLMIEGPDTLASVTARIPGIASTWGQATGFWGMGPRRISQVIIAGHGESRSVEMAGTGAPSVVDRAIRYGTIESLDLDTNFGPTRDLMHALFSNMDPATARLVFAGCLVGSTHVPFGTAPGAMPAFFANESLGAWTEREGHATGLPSGFARFALADVALGSATSLYDTGTGDVGLQYSFDQQAFSGSAETYAREGREPTGVLRAAVQVGVQRGAVAAAGVLRTRLSAPVRGEWYDDVTRAWVTEVLDGVPLGSGIDLQKANDLANAGAIIFLSRWPDSFSITVAHLGDFNTLTFANAAYGRVAAISDYTAMPDLDAKRMRLIIEQGRLSLTGAARVPDLLAAILATGLRADGFSDLLDTGVLGPHAAALLPLVGAPTTEQLRLGLAWFFRDPTNAHVRTFLGNQVVTGTGAPPAFNAAAAAEIPAGRERGILEALGLLTTTVASSGGGGASLPAANVQLPGRARNTARVEGRLYEAHVLPAVGPHGLFVRRGPGMGFAPFDLVRAGDLLRVVGFTHDWAAIEHHGRLGYVFRGPSATPFIDPPPP